MVWESCDFSLVTPYSPLTIGSWFFSAITMRNGEVILLARRPPVQSRVVVVSNRAKRADMLWHYCWTGGREKLAPEQTEKNKLPSTGTALGPRSDFLMWICVAAAISAWGRRKINETPMGTSAGFLCTPVRTDATQQIPSCLVFEAEQERGRCWL